MKKIFIILGIALTVAACGGSKPGEAEGGADSTSASNKTAVTAETNAANDTAANKIGTDAPATGKSGIDLMGANDCNTCHSEKSKVIGPALVDIAKKYTAADVETLAKKVIAGGSGNWGTVPMTAHPQLSIDDAKTMVSYILTVK